MLNYSQIGETILVSNIDFFKKAIKVTHYATALGLRKMCWIPHILLQYKNDYHCFEYSFFFTVVFRRY